MSSTMVVLCIGYCTCLVCLHLEAWLSMVPYEFPNFGLACMLLLSFLFLDAKMGWNFCNKIIVLILADLR